MKKLLIVVGALYGLYWYASVRFKFEDTLTYARRHPQAAWAPAADYYVGMVYLQRRDFPRSQRAFTQLLTDYPTGPYTARGLLRLSEAAAETSDWPVARESLERFVKEYPNHSGSRVAEQRLELIKYK